jgi:hypothetical protein
MANYMLYFNAPINGKKYAPLEGVESVYFTRKKGYEAHFYLCNGTIVKYSLATLRGFKVID